MSTDSTSQKWIARAFTAIVVVVVLAPCTWFFVHFRREAQRSPTPPLSNFADYNKLSADERVALLDRTVGDIENLAGRRKGMDRVPSDDPLVALILDAPLLAGELSARLRLFRDLHPADPRPVIAFCLKYEKSDEALQTIAHYLAWYNQSELVALVAPTLFAQADNLQHLPGQSFFHCLTYVARENPEKGILVYCRFLDLCEGVTDLRYAEWLLSSIHWSGLRDETLLARLCIVKARYPQNSSLRRSIEHIEQTTADNVRPSRSK